MKANKEYKVLSMWEPWATLVVHGVKKIETRPKPTTWTIEKGSYLIHASKKWTKEQIELCQTEPFFTELRNIGYMPLFFISMPVLPLGHIIGAVDVVECLPIWKGRYTGDYYLTDGGVPMTIEEPELSFGDYREDRYAWILDNPRVLKTHIPYKGGQGYYQNFKGDINQLEFIS